MVYILLGKGFEEIEAVTPGDLLRRAGVETAYVGLGGLEVTGSHGMTVRADLTLEQMDLTQLDMIVLPGGLGGVPPFGAAGRPWRRSGSLMRTANMWLQSVPRLPFWRSFT